MKCILRMLFTFSLVGVISVAGYTIFYRCLSSEQTKTVEVELPPGSSIMDIGRRLEEKGLVQSDFLFAIYVYLNGKSKTIQTGVYQIPPSQEPKELLAILAGQSKHEMHLVVPKGSHARTMAERFAKLGGEREKFLQAINQSDYPYSFVKEIPRNTRRIFQLEGYLYPKAYNIPKNADPREVVMIMLSQFEKRLMQPGVQLQLKKRGLTVDQWVTIASIVEREGRAKDELPRIAGVIENRLKAGKKLQVDATVQYALGTQRSRLLFKDLKIKSPYNTYLSHGLPPGPISNPGKEALMAVLYPEKHPYFFYVTKKDGSGRHYFARIETEHTRNIKKSEQEAKRQSGK